MLQRVLCNSITVIEFLFEEMSSFEEIGLELSREAVLEGVLRKVDTIRAKFDHHAYGACGNLFNCESVSTEATMSQI